MTAGTGVGWIAETAAARVNELPGAELSHPFGPEPDVYKVRGKVFMLVSPRDTGVLVTLKARPADSTVLQAAYPQITPGYHMNKKHWISISAGAAPATTSPSDSPASAGTAASAAPASAATNTPALDAQLIEDLVTESYLLVVESLPRAQRPVNPDTFAQPKAAPTADDLLK